MRAVDFTHAAGADGGDDFVGSEFATCTQQEISRKAPDFACGLPLRSSATSPIPPVLICEVIG
jgi:hypothetical protein